MPIVIHPNLPLVAAQGVTAPVVLQPGSVISARVQQILGNDTVRITVSGQSLDVQSQVPLQAGQSLQLAVSQAPDGSIALAVVSQQSGALASQAPTDPGSAAVTTDSVTLAPAAAILISASTTPAIVAATIQLTPPEALAVSVAAQSAAAQQTSLAQLFANLGVATGLGSLPPLVQQAVAQMLAQRTPLDAGLTGNDISQAFQSSGLFLEASLAAGSASPSAATSDLKAALIVLRQVLVTSLNAAPATLSTPATQGAAVAQGASATQSAPASSGVSQQALAPAATAVQQGLMPTAAAVPGAPAAAAAAPQIATAMAAAAQGVPTPAVAVPPGTPAAAVAAAAMQQGGTTVLGALTEPGAQPFVQPLSQPVTITIEPATLTVASPALAPLLASEMAAAAVLPQAAVVPTAQNVQDLGVANEIIAPLSTLADAAARAAASSAALNLLQEALQSGPLTLANPLALLFENSQMLALIPAVTGARISDVDDAEMAQSHAPPPPLSGALPAAQPVMAATLLSNSSAESAMRRLLADTGAAIARQTLLQVASLPGQADTTAARLDPTAPRWNFEIPFATPQGTAMAQFEISSDGGGNPADAAKRVWRARFTLDVEPAGPVHALVSLNGERTSVRIWAERPATAGQLRAGVAQLSLALSRAELQPGDIVVWDGAPSRSAPARAGHFLDRAL
jgi:Flagellar hook-length control protein FliK